MARWIVTREADDAAPLVAALRGRGVNAHAVPCISRAPLPWPALLDSTDATSAATPPVVFLTSPYAATRALAHAPLVAAAPRWAAMAPRTVAVLAAAGIRADVQAPGGVVALAQAVVAAWGTTSGADGTQPVVLYPTSDAGLAREEQHAALALLAHVGEVRRAAVYTTVTAPNLATTLADERARHPVVCAVFHSPSAVAAWRSAPAAEVAIAVCVGASTLAAWRQGVAPEVASRGVSAVSAVSGEGGGGAIDVVERIVELDRQVDANRPAHRSDRTEEPP